MASEDKIVKSLTIIDLNDDCLIEILKNLNSDDLISLSQTNSRFTNPIENVVPHTCIRIDEDAELEKMEKFFKKFGDKMKILYIANTNGFKELIKYVNGGKVKSCELCRVTSVLNEEFIEKNLAFFKMLESLKLNDNQFRKSVYEKMFGAITDIKRLELIGIYFNDQITNADVLTKIISFTHLKALTLSCCWFEIEGDVATLPVSTTVNELKLQLDPLEFSMLNHFPNVQNLNLKLSNETFGYEPLNMPDLKRFSLSYFTDKELVGIETIFSTLAERNSLDRLDLDVWSSDKFPEIFQNVLKITNLKELNFKLDNAPVVNIIDIANKLKQLRRFSIRGQDINDEAILCEFVQLLTELKSLRIVASAPYQSLYDKLTEIRKDKKSGTILDVEVLNNKNESPVFMQKNNWVKMSILNEY